MLSTLGLWRGVPPLPLAPRDVGVIAAPLRAVTCRWVVSPDGYEIVSDKFRRKSRIVQREITLGKEGKDGKTTLERRKPREKEVVYKNIRRILAALGAN